MKFNEKGAALVVVLLVIVVFSVLGLALMGNVVNENKRVSMTESEVQARYLAESGLTYFENEFKKYMNQTNPSEVNIQNYIESHYRSYQAVGPLSNRNEMRIMAVMDGNTIQVTSKGKAGPAEKTLIGYYKLDDRIKSPSYEIMNFNKDGTMAVDFTPERVAYLNVLNLLKLDVLNLTGNSSQYYPVPTDDSMLSLELLNPVLGIQLHGGDSFKTMKDYRVIATDDSTVLNLNAANIAMIDLLHYQGAKDINVLIDGFVPGVTLLGIPIISGYQDIEFKKLAVMGNAMIQTATTSPRRFTFDEGLYVNKSLIIGDTSSVSNLTLQGNMVTMQNANICNAALTFSGDSNLYVWGNAAISNSAIHEAASDGQNHFGLLAIGTITIHNNKSGSEYDGLYYSRSGITIITNNMPMTIKGGLIGDYTVDHPDKLTVITDPMYQNFESIKLIPQGRAYEK